MRRRAMRRYITTVCVVGLMAVGAVGAASAATPAPNKHFSGNGTNSWNRGGTWVRHGTGSFSFRTSFARIASCESQASRT